MSDDDTFVGRVVDKDALATHLESKLGPAEDYDLSRHQAGHSNETLFATWGDKSLVIRRPPPGTTADSAHDILREYRVMDALQGTNVRVPQTLFACQNHSMMGGDFYVMERINGDVLRQEEPPEYRDADKRQQISEELVDRLGEIHAVDYEAVGLADLGHPDGYIRRQVQRWQKQLGWAIDVTSAEREVPYADDIATWLDENTPDSHRHTLVHGDYKLDNVMFEPKEPPEIVGVLDWEMSSLGDPLSDLGWVLLFWQEQGDPEPPVPELMPSFTGEDGYLERHELVTRYEARTGIEFEHQRFYRVLAAFKLLGICEMFFRRHLEGNSDDPLYPKMRDNVPRLANQAVRIIDGDFSL